MSEAEILPGEVNVHVLSTPPDRQKFYRATTRTFVITQLIPYTEILSGPDPTRCSAIITALDANIVLCDSLSKAQDAANTAAGLPNANGAILPQNQPILIESGSELWIAGVVAVAPAVGRVSVISTHESSM